MALVLRELLSHLKKWSLRNEILYTHQIFLPLTEWWVLRQVIRHDTVITNVKEKYLLQKRVAERGGRCYFHLRHKEDTKGSRIWPSLYWYKHP